MSIKIMKSVFTFLICFTFSFINGQDSTALRFSQNITESTLKKHLTILSSDDYEGRGTGARGQKKAAYYIKSHFEKLGLQPINPKDSAKYYQYFLFNHYATEQFKEEIRPNKKSPITENHFYTNEVFRLKKDKIKVVWAGHGFDYANIDVKHKIAVVWLKTPPDSIKQKYNLEDSQSGLLSSIQIKSAIAKKHGAKAVFFIHQNKEDFKNFSIRSASMAKIKNSPKSLTTLNNTFGNVFFKPKALKKIFGLSKAAYLDLLENETNLPLSNTISIHFDYEFHDNKTENVIGILPGTTKQDEFIVICVHYDHLGIRRGEIYNGADDNASGTSTLLHLATQLTIAKKAGFENERNIIFIAFSGEELGLLGSIFFTSNMTIPYNSIKSVFNIDMIGRGRLSSNKEQMILKVIGTNDCIKINKTITENHFENIQLIRILKSHPERLYYRSDHYNFARHDIPFIYYSTGTHDDYHQPSDDSDKINYDFLKSITQLIFLNVWQMSR